MYLIRVIKPETYCFFELRELITFVNEIKPAAMSIKQFISMRAEELGISFYESMQDLIDSAIDYFIDKNSKL